MAGTNLPIFPQTIANWSTVLVNANGTSTVNFVSGATNGTKVESMMATSNNTSDLALDLWVNNGGSDTLLASILVVANSGNNSNLAIPAVDVLRSSQLPALPYDSNGNKYLYIAYGTNLKVSANVAVASGKVLGVWAAGANF
jgi:hypothetical protein